MRLILKTFITILVLQFATVATANVAGDPVAMLKKITGNVLASMKKHQAQLKAKPEILFTIVDQDIVPCVDTAEMARWIAGRNAWNNASGSNKKRFIKVFKVLLVNTYAKALHSYADKKTNFLPLRGTWKNKKRISVASKVINNVGQAIRIDYRLIKHGDRWKIYDVVVEGVSLLKGYQSQFSDTIKKQGLGAVIDIIKSHNKTVK
ncbi:MAG: hypothetical protein COB50_03825 [Thiotrichales bacterium]|nr:MAG: hypothetical protein COB50_03825 [Thiotrichales bacterium]